MKNKSSTEVGWERAGANKAKNKRGKIRINHRKRASWRAKKARLPLSDNEKRIHAPQSVYAGHMCAPRRDTESQCRRGGRWVSSASDATGGAIRRRRGHTATAFGAERQREREREREKREHAPSPRGRLSTHSHSVSNYLPLARSRLIREGRARAGERDDETELRESRANAARAPVCYTGDSMSPRPRLYVRVPRKETRNGERCPYD